jgi:nucleoside phosphorylase
MSRRSLCLLAGVMLCLAACGSDDGGSQAPVAVLSAFPAELAAVLDRTQVEGSIAVAGRNFRIGTIGATPVVVGMTGIGLVNAAETTRLLLDAMDVAGVVVSGVAGSSLKIGDVAVPASWALASDETFSADPAWLAAARRLTDPSGVVLENCTVRPAMPESPPICLPHLPRVVVGGTGESEDPFGGNPVACQPNGGDVFGCDVALALGSPSREPPVATVGAAAAVAATDMETAAIAREAAAAGVRFIAFRAVSDGEGDPLGLPGFPQQFFTYYRLAARNAAAAAARFVEQLG